MPGKSVRLAELEVIGIDPGGRETGIVVRRGSACGWHGVLARSGAGPLPDADYLAHVVDVVATVATECGEEPLIVVEGVREPSWYIAGKASPANVGGLMGTCMTLGAIIGRYTDAVVVGPARHGQAPLSAYPEALQPRRGSGKGHDRLRHARSAWDVAYAGLVANLHSPRSRP